MRKLQKFGVFFDRVVKLDTIDIATEFPSRDIFLIADDERGEILLRTGPLKMI